MEALILTIFGVFILASFILGFNCGIKSKRDELIKMPSFNPVKAVKEKRIEKKEEEKRTREQEIMETNLANIESYDGTGIGQRDIPS